MIVHHSYAGRLVLGLMLCALASTVAVAQEPARGGEIVDMEITAGYTAEKSVSEVARYPGASLILVHFAEMDLEPGVELVVSDIEGKVSHRYPGAGVTTDELAGVWALPVPGDTAVLELRVVDPESGLDLTESGFAVDKVGWAYPEIGLESVCGADDRRDVECYSGTHPTEVDKARAVARHVRTESPYVYFCTAWRVGAGPHMFTNQHCLEGGQAHLDASSFIFNYERTECEAGGNKPIRAVTGNELLMALGIYDFALFTINNQHLIGEFGYLEIDPRAPILGEEIYMAGHYDGLPKTLILESDMNTSGVCEVDAPVHPIGGLSRMGYFCDSSGGQSGAPVIARSNYQVIGLHHAGYNPCTSTALNQGIRMDRIWPHVESFLGSLFESGFESGDTTEWSSTGP